MQIGEVLGKYVVTGRLATGSRKTVWLGEQLGLGRAVAIHVLHPGRDPEAFRQRACRNARISHPGVVTVYDWGTHGDHAFYVSEVLRPATPDDRLKKVARVARALAHCHAQGVAHGRLSPDRVLEDARGNPVLIGLAPPEVGSAEGDLRALEALLRRWVPDEAHKVESAEGCARRLEKALQREQVRRLSRPLRPTLTRTSRPGPPAPAPKKTGRWLRHLGLVLLALVAWPRPDRPGAGLRPVVTVIRRPTPRLAVLDAQVLDRRPDQVTLRWSTTLPADSRVRLLGEDGELSRVVRNPAQPDEMDHSLILRGLRPATAYRYQILAGDHESRVRRFTTRRWVPDVPNRPLLELARSYIDKLGRMTPDEKEKLRASLSEFFPTPESLTAGRKADLLARGTTRETFHERRRDLKLWVEQLRLRGAPLPSGVSPGVPDLSREAAYLGDLYLVNGPRALIRLDAALRAASKAERRGA